MQPVSTRIVGWTLDFHSSPGASDFFVFRPAPSRLCRFLRQESMVRFHNLFEQNFKPKTLSNNAKLVRVIFNIGSAVIGRDTRSCCGGGPLPTSVPVAIHLRFEESLPVMSVGVLRSDRRFCHGSTRPAWSKVRWRFHWPRAASCKKVSQTDRQTVTPGRLFVRIHAVREKFAP